MKTNVLKIGWAQDSITPDQPVNLFGMFNERIRTHVESPCMATALAIQGPDGDHAIWVSCDLVNINLGVVADVRAATAKRIPGLDSRKLLISCTHTHNAPNFRGDLFPKPAGVMTPEAYRAFFIERVAEIASRAWAARTPGKVSAGLGHAVIGWCRRVVYANGSGLMYGDTRRDDFIKVEGPMDPGVELLFTHDMDGKPSGAVVSIACPSQTCMNESFLTADFWGQTRNQLRSHFGGNFTVLAVVGAAGDQCPDDLVRWGRSEPSRHGLEACGELAHRLTQAVIRGYDTGRRGIVEAPVFRHAHAEIKLPLYVMNAKEVAFYEGEIARLTADGEPDPTTWPGGTLLRTRSLLKRHAALKPGDTVSIDCNFLRIGDFAVATNPFELFLEYGQRIKGRSPAVQTIAAQLTNDIQGYLPTREALGHGHYSATPFSLSVGPEGGDRLVDQSVMELNKLFDKEDM